MYSTVYDLQAAIVEEIKQEIICLNEDVPHEHIISLKVMDAIRETVRERHYPNYYTDEMIIRDLENFYPNIKAKTWYKGNILGAEFQTSHSENGVSRSWVEYERLSNGVLPIARIS